MSRNTTQPASFDTLPIVNPHAAGLDIGSDEIWACVPPDRDPQPVRKFGTFTPDLQALVNWLAAGQVTMGGLLRVKIDTFNRFIQRINLAQEFRLDKSMMRFHPTGQRTCQVVAFAMQAPLGQLRQGRAITLTGHQGLQHGTT